MDKIHLLPDSVANQIAAGEVIQRPASVIKELVENAVDAGADEIKIIIKDAGRTLIQVVDNGCGMSETDARMAFERHATSKIFKSDDLDSLRTMGFRGEALPSICAVSQLELRTRMESSRLGSRLEIEGSKVMAQEPCVCDKGCNFMVKNLFFNVRARRKFLKSDAVELSNIMREFERLALVNNDIHLSIDTGSRQIDLPAASFRQRIADIWKNNLNMQLLPLEVDTSLVKISGFVCKPEFARRRNPLQYLIVNGRNMRHPYFHRAVVNCYEKLIATDTQPCYFIKFEVDPASIDVNVHPTKNEIKFEYETEIWRILTAAVKATLGKFSVVPAIDFDSDSIEVNPVRPGEHVESPDAGLSGISFRAEGKPKFDSFTQNPFSGGGAPPQRQYTPKDRPPNDWEKLYSDFLSQKISDHRKQAPEEERSKDICPSPLCLQFAEKYIITKNAQGLLVIDQHRAHVKVLYEQFLASTKEHNPVVQHLMFPEIIPLDPEQQLALEGVEEEVRKMGFIIEYLEDNKWQITGVPALLKNANAKDLMLRILDSESDDSLNYGKEGELDSAIVSRVALLMARSAAIKRGQPLTQEEMEHLMARLFSLKDPKFTPSGNVIFTIVPESRIQSLFS